MAKITVTTDDGEVMLILTDADPEGDDAIGYVYRNASLGMEVLETSESDIAHNVRIARVRDGRDERTGAKLIK